MSWKTPIGRKIAKVVSETAGVRRHIINDEHVQTGIAQSERLMKELLGRSPVLVKVLSDRSERTRLGLSTVIPNWVDRRSYLDSLDVTFLTDYLRDRVRAGTMSVPCLISAVGNRTALESISLKEMLEFVGPERMLEFLGPERMLEFLGPERMLESLGPERMLEFLGPDRMLKHLGPERMLEFLGPDRMLKHLGPQRMLEFLGPDRMLKHLGPERMLEFLGPDRMLKHLGPERMLAHLGPERMLEHLGPDRMLKHLGPERMLEFLGPERMLKYLGPERMLAHLGPERMLAHLGPERMLEHLGADRMLKHLGPERMLEHLGADRMLKHLPPERMLAHLGNERLIAHLGTRNTRLLEEIRQDDKALEELVSSETALVKILHNRNLRDRFFFVHQRRIAGAIPYSLPAVVVAYPRSGSNLLQSVLMQSSGLNNQSIYGRKNLFVPAECVLTVKSHAVTPAYLIDEYARKVEQPAGPERVILLQRDPRDVMISFYEFTQFNRRVSIAQESFLTDVCFFYASAIDPGQERREENAPLSVGEAYKKHVRGWFCERPAGLSCLVIRYEDLILDTRATFEQVFQFLCLDCALAEEFMKVRVSLYDNTRERRGVPYGWLTYRDKYAALLESVHRHFRSEIDVLGYPEDPVPLCGVPGKR